MMMFSLVIGMVSSSSTNRKIDIIAHRGAPNLRPEHTYESYLVALQQGADYIELDLMVTKDNVLVSTHSFELSEVTNVANLTKFSDRKKIVSVDGKQYNGWFINDFTFAELQELRVNERFSIRNQAFNGLFTMPSLEQVLQYLNALSLPNKVKLYVETKHPNYFENTLGLNMIETLVDTLNKYAYLETTMFQSFESTSLKKLKSVLEKNNLKSLGLVMLIEPNRVQNDTGVYYEEYLEAKGLDEIAKVATGIGPFWGMVNKKWVEECHKRNLIVHPYTFRSEGYFLQRTKTFNSFEEFITQFIEYGVDGFFTEDIELTKKIIADYYKGKTSYIQHFILVILVALVATIGGATLMWGLLHNCKSSRHQPLVEEKVASISTEDMKTVR
ncbi:hypothetical protein ABK040_006903 [Willaertia magna]